MDKYKKGKNVEEPFDRSQITMKNLPDDFLWMHVNPGTKMRNVLDYAMAEMKTQRAIVWSGSGPAVGKTISCAEIMKRQFKNLHQVNQICFRKVKEYWDPLLEDLDPLVVIRELPTIHILLCKDPPVSQPGYQPPEEVKGPRRNLHNKERPQNKSRPKRIDAGKFESLGLQSSRTKGPKQNFQKRSAYSQYSETGSSSATTERAGERSSGQNRIRFHHKERRSSEFKCESKSQENKEGIKSQIESPSGIG